MYKIPKFLLFLLPQPPLRFQTFGTPADSWWSTKYWCKWCCRRGKACWGKCSCKLGGWWFCRWGRSFSPAKSPLHPSICFHPPTIAESQWVLDLQFLRTDLSCWCIWTHGCGFFIFPLPDRGSFQNLWWRRELWRSEPLKDLYPSRCQLEYAVESG